MEVALLGGSIDLLTAGGARDVASARRQRLEDRVQTLHGFFDAANHHAITAFDPPDAAAGADVDIVKSLRLEGPGAANIVLEIGIAPVDDDIVRLHEPGECVHRIFRWAPRRNHHPGGPGFGQFLDELLQRSAPGSPFVAVFGHAFDTAVVYHARMSAAHQALDHVAAHSSETDHAELHEPLPDASAKRR
jgi:hypothetical protein